MTPETTETQENERSQRARKLLILLVACVLVMSSLLCCGQVALLLATSSRTVDTLSLLRADYSPWGYGKVGVINASGYIKDLQKDQEQEGVVVVVPGDNIEPGSFWPTGIPTPMPVAAITETASLTPIEFLPTLTETVAPSITPTPTISGGMPQGTATRTPTSTRTAAAATLTPTPSPTHTFTYVPQPTRTHTQAPVEPSNTPVPPTRTHTLPAATATRTNTVPVVIATHTPTRTNTVAPTGTFTPTITVPVVIPTFTFTPTHTPTTPVPPPTFTFTPTPTATPIPYIMYPKAENGISDPDPGNPDTGCHGYFGYINTNPNTVVIPPGSSNYLSTNAYGVFTGDPDYIDGLPSNFYTGEWTGILHVQWDTGTPITWTINGASATLGWCH